MKDVQLIKELKAWNLKRFAFSEQVKGRLREGVQWENHEQNQQILQGCHHHEVGQDLPSRVVQQSASPMLSPLPRPMMSSSASSLSVLLVTILCSQPGSLSLSSLKIAPEILSASRFSLLPDWALSLRQRHLYCCCCHHRWGGRRGHRPRSPPVSASPVGRRSRTVAVNWLKGDDLFPHLITSWTRWLSWTTKSASSWTVLTMSSISFLKRVPGISETHVSEW